MHLFTHSHLRVSTNGLLIVLFLLGCSRKISIDTHKIEIKPNRFHAVRFDPSYYYNTDLKVKDLCEMLVRRWRDSRINVVYIKVYDPVHGAVYRTKHPYNVQTDYGRLNFLRAMLDACHRENIRVYAWIPAFLHKHAWEAHSEWRVQKSDSTDYQPTSDSYFLCVRQPEFRQWWIGFVEELLERHRDLDGVDIAEPIVAPKPGDGCFCDLCQEALRREKIDDTLSYSSEALGKIRSEPLVTLLEETCRVIHSHGTSSSITTVATPHNDGRLLSVEEQMILNGFDLDALLESQGCPAIINVELIWQQWADFFQDTITFSPEWTVKAGRQFMEQVADRTNTVIHVELTSLGGITVSEKQFLQTLKEALNVGAWGIDFYDSYQVDVQVMWAQIAATLDHIPTKKVVLYYDPEGENDALQIDVLLRHFQTETILVPLEDSFSSTDQPEADVIFYLGVTSRSTLPAGFIRFISQTDKIVCWLNHNVEYLGQLSLSKWGFAYHGLEERAGFQILYKGNYLSKTDSLLHVVQIQNNEKCQIVASAQAGEEYLPYVIRSDNFWYFSDLPTNYVVEGGRHIVFADLLHDILEEDHQEKHLALVRIEDVNPESDPQSLRAIANFLESRQVPFSVGVTPFYLDPATNTTLSLSDVPELVKALRHMISKGGTIVLHGCTHQYRGQTTVDYEFWDSFTNQPIFQNSNEYVEERIDRALDECVRNGIYPLVWETPHYAASQLTYTMIDQIFSTVYERRQTMDLLGTDQLLPYFIPARGTQSQMIPENLGYIPADSPTAGPVVEGAQKSLAIRDGIASFFFHPFVPLNVLEEVVKRIQALGYSFADIRLLNNRVGTPFLNITSGESKIVLELKDQYLHEFFLTSKGRTKDRKMNEERLTTEYTDQIICPPGWIHIAEVIDEKRPGLLASLWASISRSPLKIGRYWQVQSLYGANTPVSPLVLIDPDAEGILLTDQTGFFRAFESVGIDCRAILVSDFFRVPKETNLLVVPYAAALRLTEQQVLFILDACSRGMNLIVEKESNLSSGLGISSTDGEKKVVSVRDEYYPQVDIHWHEEGRYKNFEVPIDYVTYYSNADNDDPIVIGGEYGEGKYLYVATLFDPTTTMGFGRFPYVLDLIQRQFGLWPTVKRECVEIYFDPGEREDISVEELVKMWRRMGVRQIYVAGWLVYPEWTYEYERLIELAHQNAMLVHLWVELPHVNEVFWLDHPEWREKTATGEEAFLGGRQLMAIADEACRKAVFEEISGFIQQYDWDGVHLGEIHFESVEGPEHPDKLTPFHPSVRESFEAQYGFDPVLIFDFSSSHFWKRNARDWMKFQEFCASLASRLQSEFVSFLHQQARMQERYMDVTTTFGEWYSVDSGIVRGDKTSSLEQSEDGIPSFVVTRMNVVPKRTFEESDAPTGYPTGIELYQTIRDTFEKSVRTALYTESSIYEVDLPWISYVLGYSVREMITPFQWEITSDNTVAVELNTKRHKDIIVDDKLWPAYCRGRAIIPSGSHTIRPVHQTVGLSSPLKSTTRLVDISGELESCRMHSRGLEFSYRSPSMNYVIINEEPQGVYVDGKLFDAEVYHGIPGFSIKLPPGFRTVRIYTQSAGTLSLKNFSIVVSLLIVLVSGVAGSSLILLYMRGRRRRHRQNE